MADSAKDIMQGLEGSGLVEVAIWRTMKDERVRPQVRVRNDCNCRCFLEYRLVDIEEAARLTGKSVEEVNKIVEKSAESGIIKNITVDDFKPIYDKIEAEKGKYVHKECIDEIVSALGDTGNYFDSVEMLSIPPALNGKTVLLQTNVTPKGNWANVCLRINEDIFKGKTLKGINEIILNSHKKGHSVVSDLKEAVLHEIGHAKLMYNKTYARAEAITDMLSDYHVEGISKIAKINGDECIAECYVLKRRGNTLPEEAEKLYNKYMKE